MRRRLIILLFVCVTLLLALVSPRVMRQIQSDVEDIPPGISAPNRRLLRVWLVSDILGSTSWLKKQAALFEDENKGAAIYLRTARPDEIAEDSVLPDLILFGPGVLSSPETLFLPLKEDFPLEDGTLRAGRWQGQQLSVTLCLSGYGLCYDIALTGATAAPPSQTPLLGIGPTPAPISDTVPDETVSFQKLMNTLQSVPAAGKQDAPVYDFQCASGMPLLLFSALSGGRAETSRAALPPDFANVSQENAYTAFLSGRSRAAMLTAGQMQALQRQGKPFFLLPSPLAATDLYLSAGIVAGGDQALAQQFLAMLLSKEGQTALLASGLFPARMDITLYGGDLVLSTLEQSLKVGRMLPNAFAYNAQSLAGLSKSAWFGGGDVKSSLESLR